MTAPSSPLPSTVHSSEYPLIVGSSSIATGPTIIKDGGNGGTSTPNLVGKGLAGPNSGAAPVSNAIGGTFGQKSGLSQLKGGVIMDVRTPEEAKIAEEAGACAILVLEKLPSDIVASKAQGNVARMCDVGKIKEIIAAVTIPVVAQCRIGHFIEAQILQQIGVDFIDESEVLSPADGLHHITKHPFRVPFISGASSLGEALRRISEGATLVRTKGSAGSGDIRVAVEEARKLIGEVRRAGSMGDEELYAFARDIQAPFHLLKETARLKRLPVVNFGAGGISTPADAALMMSLGCDGVFVGSGIFSSPEPLKTAKAIVQAVTHFQNPIVLAQVSEGLGGLQL